MPHVMARRQLLVDSGSFIIAVTWTGGHMGFEYLENDGGRIAFEDTVGDGPLVVLMPPMGALRSVYRFVTPKLVDAGYRVVTLDLRGHGQSSTGWTDHSIAAHGRDALALISKINAGPAFLVGNSFTGGVAVWAAVERSDLVRGIALIGSFVRTLDVNPLMGLVMKLMFAGPWGPAAWMSYYPKMYPGPKPDDFAEHLAATRKMMKEPGRFESFKQIAAASKRDSETRLALVKMQALVIMGSADPDFPDALAEAEFQAKVLNAKKVIIEGSGHHPQADSPDKTATALIEFFELHVV